MIFGIVLLSTALTLSIVAAFYSVTGLVAIFAALPTPIIIMGSTLEVAKIITTVFLHNNWRRLPFLYKAYLVPAVAILMFLTSVGIFGLLSKAHSDQGLVSGEVGAKIAIYDEKIKISRDNIDANRKALQQMDAAVDQTMSRSNDEKGADRAVSIRRSQSAERSRLLKEIEQEQKKITALNDEAAPIRAEVRKVEADVGPLKYVATLIYGDNPDSNLLEKAVRWVIILIVIVFDPLALTLILSANKQFEWALKGEGGWVHKERDDEEEQEEQEPKEEKDVEPKVWSKFFKKNPADNVPNINEPIVEDQHTHIPVATYYASIPPSSNIDKKDLAEDPMIAETPAYQVGEDVNDESIAFESPNAPGLDASNERPGDYLVAEEVPVAKKKYVEPLPAGTEIEQNAMSVWKAANPQSTFKEQYDLLDAGKIPHLPWEHEEHINSLPLSDGERARLKIGLVADNEPQGNVRGFGTAFPDQANKGDMFLRVDQLPTQLFKYNGSMWIRVNKNLSDTYAYDDAYIDHLISKISTGEYDPELLTDSERERIEEKLNTNT